MTNNGFSNNVLSLLFLSVSAPPSRLPVDLIRLCHPFVQGEAAAVLCFPVFSWNILALFNTSPCLLCCSASVFTQTDVISRPRPFSAQPQCASPEWKSTQSETEDTGIQPKIAFFWIVQCRDVVDFHFILSCFFFKKGAQNTVQGLISCFIMTWHCLRKTCSWSKRITEV